MSKYEQVIDALECVMDIDRPCNPGCEYFSVDAECDSVKLCRDCFELLKEQQPRKVQNIRKVTDICLCGECPSCGKRVFTSTNQNFCGHCGDRLTWKDGEQE